MIDYKIFTDITDAENVWRLLSPNDEIYDDWDFRYIYFLKYNTHLHFIAAYEDENIVALLPLQWNYDKKCFDFFGGRNFFSLNRIFTKKGFEYLRKELVEKIDKPYYLRWMTDSIENVTAEDNGIYILNLQNLNNIDDYFNTYWHGEKKKKIKKYIRQLNETGIKIYKNRYEDYEVMTKLNTSKFGEKSLFNQKERIEFFKDLINKFNVDMISLEINNQIVGVAYRIIYNNKLYGINSGVVDNISNLGRYLFIETIKSAIENKIESYNALEGNYGWKEDFGFKKKPQYQVVNLQKQQS